jgi:general secretion pathway protein M
MATLQRSAAAATPITRFTGSLAAELARLSPRERNAVLIALWFVGLSLLWWLAVAPALATLREAPARHARLDAQLGQMQRMMASANALRAESTAQTPGRDEVLRSLEAATASLGTTAQLSVLGDRATLTLRGTPPAELAQWLAQVRINARLLPLQTQLTRDASTAGWNGTVVLSGPGLTGGG